MLRRDSKTLPALLKKRATRCTETVSFEIPLLLYLTKRYNKAMNTHSASIIIPTLNEENYLPALLNSLKGVTFPIEIIVVDGNSDDNTATVVEKFKPFFFNNSSLRLLTSKRGIALQRNFGATEAKYDLLIFCDADIVFLSVDTYQKMVSEFIEKKQGIINSKNWIKCPPLAAW